jgi:hypothetical protein
MSFSEPDTTESTLLSRIIDLEEGLRKLGSEHQELWARVGAIGWDITRIYSLIQTDTAPHTFAFSPLERLSSVEGALAVLSNKLEALNP